MLSTLKFSVIATALAQAALVKNAADVKIDSAVISNIRSHVESYAPTAAQCVGTNCCTVSSTESCSISTMPKDVTTLVLPGGETRCIYSYSTPFAFQVNMMFYLLIYF